MYIYRYVCCHARALIGVDEGVCATIIIIKNVRFLSSNINNKRTPGMGTPSQDAGECERKQLINTHAKL